MRLYTDTLRAFVTHARSVMNEIVTSEMHPKSGYQPFTDLDLPEVACFDDDRRVGFFDQNLNLIGLSRRLAYAAGRELLRDVLRHELAHWFIWKRGISGDSPHDPTFRAICRQFGWKESVSSASLDVERSQDKLATSEEEMALVERVQKLLELTRSDNIHEAELAALRANEMILKYHLSHVGSVGEVTAYVDTVLQCKRVDAKMRAIAAVLRCFLVAPVFNRTRQGVWLEVTGARADVIVAGHVASFLNIELDRMWARARKESGLSGITARTNFMVGVGAGYRDKHGRLTQTLNAGKALAKVDCELESMLNLAYPNLRRTTCRFQGDDAARRAGQQAGKNLHIRRPLKTDVSDLKGLLK